MLKRRTLLELVKNDGKDGKTLVEPKGTDVVVAQQQGGLQHFQHSKSPRASLPASRMR
jgi:hypothetical protein